MKEPGRFSKQSCLICFPIFYISIHTDISPTASQLEVNGRSEIETISPGPTPPPHCYEPLGPSHPPMNPTCSLSGNHLTWPFIILFVFSALALAALLDFLFFWGQKSSLVLLCPTKNQTQGHTPSPRWGLVQPMPRFYLPGRDLWTRSLRSSTSEILGMTSKPHLDSSSSIAGESTEEGPGKKCLAYKMSL